MKIIKVGEGWSKQVSCRGCKAVLKLDESDIQYKVTDFDAVHQHENTDIEGTFYVTCPMCAQEIQLKSGSIPKPIADRLKETI